MPITYCLLDVYNMQCMKKSSHNEVLVENSSQKERML